MLKKIKVKDFCKLIEMDQIKIFHDSEDNVSFSMLDEGKKWSEKGMTLRLDSPNAYAGQQQHIHVKTKQGNYAWNKDGSRSHVGSWPNTEPTEKIRQVAADALGIDASLLENYMDCYLTVDGIDSNFKLLLENIDYC